MIVTFPAGKIALARKIALVVVEHKHCLRRPNNGEKKKGEGVKSPKKGLAFSVEGEESLVVLPGDEGIIMEAMVSVGDFLCSLPIPSPAKDELLAAAEKAGVQVPSCKTTDSCCEVENKRSNFLKRVFCIVLSKLRRGILCF